MKLPIRVGHDQCQSFNFVLTICHQYSDSLHLNNIGCWANVGTSGWLNVMLCQLLIYSNFGPTDTRAEASLGQWWPTSTFATVQSTISFLYLFSSLIFLLLFLLFSSMSNEVQHSSVWVYPPVANQYSDRVCLCRCTRVRERSLGHCASMIIITTYWH